MIHSGEHIRVYDAALGLSGGSRSRLCELTGRPYAHVCHIDASGMGGRPSTNVIENLMALHPVIHLVTEGRREWKEWLRLQHARYLEDRVPVAVKAPMDETYAEIWKEAYPLFNRRGYQNNNVYDLQDSI